MPDIENSRKTAEKGAEWVLGNVPVNQPEKQPIQSKQLFCLRCFMFFRLFFGCFALTHSAPFSAVFRLFSMSGIWPPL